MVRDLMMDLREMDLLFEDKSNVALPVFNAVWGNLFDADSTIDALICNIIIPEAYWTIAKYDDNGELLCRFTSPYQPKTDNFRIRLVAMKNGTYNLFAGVRGEFGLPVKSYALSKNISAPIAACMLPFIDIDGDFLIKFVQNPHKPELDKAYIYSSKDTDISVHYSDDQAAQLLTLCAPGKYYRYPTTGVGIGGYLNCVVSHTELSDILEKQFSADNKSIREANFDSETCGLDMLFNPESEVADENLTDIDRLGSLFFSLFTDEYVRRNIVINEVTDLDYIRLLSEYNDYIEIVFFPSYNTSATRIAYQVEPGKFNSVGDIVEDDEYLIVTATLEANTIVMFDDDTEDEIKGSPVFIINGSDQTRLYTALIEQPYWITETCHKCFVLLRRSAIQYMIKKTQFQNGKGLYMVPQTSENVKNMLSIAQDANTGRLLGIVSNNTNISDITLEEITQYIYTTKIND